MLSIVVVDVDAKIALEERQAYAAAQTRQIVEHFEPEWTICAAVRAATPADPPRPGEIQIFLIDKPTRAGALGYHSLLPNGTPVAYVFTGLAKQFGNSWTSIASHEVLELLADPYLRRAVQCSDGFWDLEVCDRVEQSTYMIDGVEVSNFNFPECFEPPENLLGIKFDYLGLSTKPNQVLDGGYAQRFDTQTGWVQIGSMRPYRAHLAACGISRTSRRRAAMPRRRSWFVRHAFWRR